MLRSDERTRLGARMRVHRLEPRGAPLSLAVDEPALVIVAEGRARVTGREQLLFPGDSTGAVAVATGRGQALTLDAGHGGATLLLVDRAIFARMLEDFPAVAPAFLAEVARELKWKNDLLREVSLAHAEGLPDEQLAAVLHSRRRRLKRRTGGPGVVRRAT